MIRPGWRRSGCGPCAPPQGRAAVSGTRRSERIAVGRPVGGASHPHAWPTARAAECVTRPRQSRRRAKVACSVAFVEGMGRRGARAGDYGAPIRMASPASRAARETGAARSTAASPGRTSCDGPGRGLRGQRQKGKRFTGRGGGPHAWPTARAAESVTRPRHERRRADSGLFSGLCRGDGPPPRRAGTPENAYLRKRVFRARVFWKPSLPVTVTPMRTSLARFFLRRMR